MSDPEGGELSFGEKLLGMQGFNAERARRYRAELEKLLVHRITTMQRWTMGASGLMMFLAFEIVAIACIVRLEGPFPPETRWTFAISFAVLGLLMGGWFLRMAFRGGFSRRLGDMMGVAIVLVFGGAAASLFYSSAWKADDAISREQLLFGAVTVMACTIGCIVLAAIQAMHRRTSEKLLRIEYHLAELMERNSGSTSP